MRPQCGASTGRCPESATAHSRRTAHERATPNTRPGPPPSFTLPVRSPAFSPCAAHNARGSGSRRPQLKRGHAGRPRAYRTGLAAKVQPSCGRCHTTVLVRTRAFESGRDDSSVSPSASAEEEAIVTGVLVAIRLPARAIVASRVSPRTAKLGQHVEIRTPTTRLCFATQRLTLCQRSSS